MTIIFDNGIEFKFDFDYWFEFNKFLQNLRGEIYDRGFPHTNREYPKNFAKKEATRSLQKIEETISGILKEKSEGWGKHGIKKDFTDRKSINICHKEDFSISSISEMDKLRNCFEDIKEEPEKIVKENKQKIKKTSEDKIEKFFPFEIKPNTIEGYISHFLLFRKPGGGFEYQVYRFIQENYGIVEKEKIKNALLRLEVHGYLNVKSTPKKLKKRMEKQDIKRYTRFYELNTQKINENKIKNELKYKTDIGAYLFPFSKKKLIKKVDAPSHHVKRKTGKLIRKNYLSERKVKDFLGRTVRKIKPKRYIQNPTKLERKIITKVRRFYDIQKECLDEMQEERPE